MRNKKRIVPISDQALSQLLAHKLARIVCLGRPPKPGNTGVVILRLEPKWLRSLVVVEWSYYSNRIIIEKNYLSEFFSLIFVGKMCIFVHVQ